MIKKAPSSYLKKFYFDTITFDPGMLRHLIERFGADHVVLGTDYPYDMGVDDPVGFINKVTRLSRDRKGTDHGRERGAAAGDLDFRYQSRICSPFQCSTPFFWLIFL